jgi:S1-C subfamily serine protease
MTYRVALFHKSAIFLFFLVFVVVMTSPISAADLNTSASLLEVAEVDLTADELRTIEVFEKAKASVVFINTIRRMRDPWKKRAYAMTTGSGSGFVWDMNGHIVTNHHVMEDADEITVRMPDRREFHARLVGESEAYDLAVIKVDFQHDAPHPLKFVDTPSLRVGQRTLAIGNPFGLDLTLTAGVVSALDRSLMDDDGNLIQHLVQTDAAINPGNSGGPLLDSSGNLIGMNTAIFSSSGTSTGVGFAIPTSTLNRVIPVLIRDGLYVRPSLGIRVDDGINKIAQSELGFRGVMVIAVEKGSPAERGGLRGTRFDHFGNFSAGDIISAIDDDPIECVEDLLKHLEDKAVGQTVHIRFQREGISRLVSLKLEALG